MNSALKICVLVFISNLTFVLAQKSHPISEIETKLSQTPKYTIIELYTDWCGVCAIQSKKINKNEELISLLEDKFYYIKFDAESKESFIFNKYQFQNKDQKIHDFAKMISPDSISFPTWVIMSPDLEIVFRYYGLLEPEQLILILEQIL